MNHIDEVKVAIKCHAWVSPMGYLFTYESWPIPRPDNGSTSPAYLRAIRSAELTTSTIRSGNSRASHPLSSKSGAPESSRTSTASAFRSFASRSSPPSAKVPPAARPAALRRPPVAPATNLAKLSPLLHLLRPSSRRSLLFPVSAPPSPPCS
jgi:hypothetical protein